MDRRELRIGSRRKGDAPVDPFANKRRGGRGMKMLAILAVVFGSGTAECLEITYEEAIESTLARSPVVRRAAAEVALAETREAAILAATDLKFVAEGGHAWDEAPNPGSEIFGSRNIRNNLGFEIQKSTLVGTRLSLGAETARNESNSIFAADFSPWFESSVSLSIRQSLLKNLLGRPDRVQRAGARAGVKAALGMYERAKSAARVEGAEAFLDFVAADRELVLRKEAADDAGKFLAKTQEKAQYSLIDKSSMAQARVNLELREIEFERAKTLHIQAKTRLLTVMQAIDEIPSDAKLKPLWSFSRDNAQNRGLDVKEALAMRPDVAALAAREKMARSALKVAGLNKIPSLDLVGSYGLGGMDTSHQKSVDDLTGGDHPTYMLGFEIVVPFRSAREKNEEEVARQNLEIAQAGRIHIESLARLEILNAHERLALAERQLAAAEKIVLLQALKLEMERKSFEQGRSTTEVLIRFAEEERGAKRQVLHARIEMAKARENLRHSAGIRGGER